MADGDDLIEIEWLEPDAGAFGPGGSSTRTEAPAAVRPPRRERSGRALPRWLPVAAVAVVAVAATVVIWRPWQHDPSWRTLPVAVRVSPELSEQLVLPDLADDFLQISGGEWGEEPITNSIGYVFAEPGGTWEASRWAKFYAAPSGSFAPLGDANSAVVIDGTPARLVDNAHGRITVAWGPVNSQRWGVDTNGLTRTEAIAFAQAVAIVDGKPVLRADYDLGDLQPVGDLETFDRVRAMLTALQGNSSSVMHTPTALSYATADEVSVGLTSIVAPPDSLAMAAFVFGGGAPLTVHGLPARVAHRDDLGTVVSWLEGNRLIAVAATTRTDAVVTMAESVRPATDAEWTALTTQQSTISTDGLPITGLGQLVGSGSSPQGTAWAVRVWVSDGSTVVCTAIGADLQSRCQFVAGALPGDMQLDGIDSSELHVYFQAGPPPKTISVTSELSNVALEAPFVAVTPELSAVAVLVPPGATVTVTLVTVPGDSTPVTALTTP